MDAVKKLLTIAIPLAIAAVIINDAGRYLQAQYELGNVTRDAAYASAAAYKQLGGDRTASWRAGEALAEKFGAVVYGFDVRDERVHVWTRMPVNGTWAVQRLAAVIDKKPADTPLTIEATDMALVQ